MNNTTAWLTVVLFTLLMGVAFAGEPAGTLSETELARAVAADLSDAQQQARAEFAAQARAALAAKKAGQP